MLAHLEVRVQEALRDIDCLNSTLKTFSDGIYRITLFQKKSSVKRASADDVLGNRIRIRPLTHADMYGEVVTAFGVRLCAPSEEKFWWVKQDVNSRGVVRRPKKC